jgi:P27 family predicted phage terminase small subunit
MPEMPKGMAPAARREWAQIAPILMRLGVLSNIDGKALAAYCDAYAMWELARKDLTKNGLVLDAPVLDKDNNPVMYDGNLIMVRKQNPAFAIYNSAAKLMKSFLIEFGLTPASRAKLKIEKPKENDDPMAALLARKPQAAAEIKNNAPLMFNTGAKPGKPEFGANIPDGAVDFEA